MVIWLLRTEGPNWTHTLPSSSCNYSSILITRFETPKSFFTSSLDSLLLIKFSVLSLWSLWNVCFCCCCTGTGQLQCTVILACTEACWNGSHSCQVPAWPMYSNARGNLWDLRSGNEDRNHVVCRIWRSILFVGYVAGKWPSLGPCCLLAGGYPQCFVIRTFPELLRGLSKLAWQSVLPSCSSQSYVT